MKQYKVEIKNIENAIYTIEAANESSAKSVAQDMFAKGIKPMVSYERAIDSRFIKNVLTEAEKTDVEKREAKYKIYTEVRLSDWLGAYIDDAFLDYADIVELAPIDVWNFWVLDIWEKDWQEMSMWDIGKFILEQIKYANDPDECVISLQNNLKQVSKQMAEDGYNDWYAVL